MNDKRITYKGVTKNQAEWADFFGITRGAVSFRIHQLGEQPEQAIAYFATRPRAAGPNWATAQLDGLSSLSSRGLLREILAELKGLRTDRRAEADAKQQS